MTEREQVEQRIREVLATEARAVPLSNQLFRPDGLFNQLARTEEECRAVAQSPLFQQALRRLSELQQQESAEFSRAVAQLQPALPDEGYRLKLEPADRR
jgi:hypothetical protein